MALHGTSANVAPLVVESANVIAQRNGTTAQTFNVYNTYTDASNYEVGRVAWSSNVAIFGTTQAGTGTARVARFGTAGAADAQFMTGGTVRWNIDASNGHLYAFSDGAYDIGASSGNRPRNGFFTSFVCTAATTVGGLTGATASIRGARHCVTDANATTFNSIVAGGGANVVPVFCDGTNWRIG